MADTYTCVIRNLAVSQDAKATIGPEGVDVLGVKESFFVDYSQIKDFRLLNYHLFLVLEDREIEISMLGKNTEEFFEKLWRAYSTRSEAALFIRGSHIMDSEGDYSYKEEELTRVGKARLGLFDDSLCILPHNNGARRIPLCFVKGITVDGYVIDIITDTAEIFQIARLGKDHTPFVNKLTNARKNAEAAWKNKLNALQNQLEERTGTRLESLNLFKEIGGKIVVGLFSTDEEDESFWVACLKNGKAAVELVIGESAATYFYNYASSDEEFEKVLQHAMEAVGTHREVIYMEEGELKEKPLYLMSVERSIHVRTLRKSNAGKAAHTSDWAEKIKAFLL